jgi:hypothetical protein
MPSLGQWRAVFARFRLTTAVLRTQCVTSLQRTLELEQAFCAYRATGRRPGFRRGRFLSTTRLPTRYATSAKHCYPSTVER